MTKTNVLSLSKNDSQEQKIPFFNCRNVSSPYDDVAGRKVYAGVARADAFLALNDDENVRKYLVGSEGKKVSKRSSVHRAIQETLREEPEIFSLLNGGIVIVADEARLHDSEKTLVLINASIVNGSQTRGEIRDFYNKHTEDDVMHPYVSYQVVVVKKDSDLRARISIARNSQNKVQDISILGTLGHLDELEKAFQQTHPKLKLRKKESDHPSGVNDSDDDAAIVSTEKLIQVMVAMMPPSLAAEMGWSNPAAAYSQKAKCLQRFEEVWQAQDDEKSPKHDLGKKVYGYMMSVAGPAWALYCQWASGVEFERQNFKKGVERDEVSGKINLANDGLVFPILHAYSTFIKQTQDGWVVDIPSEFDIKWLVAAAKRRLQESEESNPQTMGKSQEAYSTMRQVTQMFAEMRGN